MKDFRNIMSKRTDSELLEITIIFRDDYQPEALAAAEIKLKSRNLTDEQLADAQQQLDNKKWKQEKKDEKYMISKRTQLFVVGLTAILFTLFVLVMLM